MTVLRLLPASFRFVAREALVPRRGYAAGVLILTLAGQTFLALKAGDSGDSVPAGIGLLLAVGMWGLAAPLCRSWLDDDVRLGYAAFWLQAPLSPFHFYLSRLGAILGWAAIASLAVAATALPSLLIPGWGAIDLLANAVGAGWIPIILVTLAFFGSGVGARNAGLFAYGCMFGAYALEGVTDAVGASGVYAVLRHLFPPARSALDAAGYVQGGHWGEAVASLMVVAAYGLAVAVLGILLALRVPGRLGRGE